MGYSIFGGDITAANDLTNVLSFPTNTGDLGNGGVTIDGGLDFVYPSGAYDSDGQLQAVAATAIPTLSTYLLAFLSLGLIGVYRRYGRGVIAS